VLTRRLASDIICHSTRLLRGIPLPMSYLTFGSLRTYGV
jgi:hypothetical protein